MVPNSCPEIDVEFVHFLGGLLERFRHPSILKNKPNQWSVCTDHSFGLFSVSMCVCEFLHRTMTPFLKVKWRKIINNRARTRDGPKWSLEAPLGLPLETFWLPFGVSWDPATDRPGPRRPQGGPGRFLGDPGCHQKSMPFQGLQKSEKIDTVVSAWCSNTWFWDAIVESTPPKMAT